MSFERESELNFLCDTFRKCHVSVCSAALSAPATILYPYGFYTPHTQKAEQEETVGQHLGEILPETVYKIRDEMNRCYRYLILPDGKNSTVLFIGPYFDAPVSPAQTLELAERLGIPPKSQRYFDEYYSSIPLLEGGNYLFIMLDTFCERLWNRPSFAIVDRNREHLPVSPIHEGAKNEDLDGILVGMKTMETRYGFENELMRAVSLGQIHKEEQLFPSFSDFPFEKRTTDPLRNAKNYCIIMNTLLRKAAEQGGVHPLHLNNISSEFAVKIEQLSSLTENAYLMREMFRSYCRLVRKHSMKNYSLLVQKTLLLIDSDLSADLTLSTLAKRQNVTGGYLATVFKRETGKTVSEYIRERRVKHASYLLATTHLQVQTVALHCGIVDVQYFSKIFKKETGKTPKEYREDAKN